MTLRPSGTQVVNGKKLPRFTDEKGNEFVRNPFGELVRADAAKRFKKPYPLPPNLAKVAAEVLGTADPISLPESVRIERMNAFFSEAFEHAQERLATDKSGAR